MRISIAAAVMLTLAATPSAAQRVRPVLDVGSGRLLAVVVDGTWRDAEHNASLVRGGERYRVFANGAARGVATGSRANSIEEPCPDTYLVELTPKMEEGVGDVAVVGSWNVRPRPVTRGDASLPAYQNAVREMLVRHGIRNPVVRITGILRADLDGDGTEEAVLSATRSQAAGESTRVRAGDYSLVIVRKLVGGVARTIMLEEEYHPRTSEEEILNTFTLGGIYDLDGDGQYEILVHGQYYEGDWSTVYRIRGTTPRMLATAGCGV
ncbi:hypothetical protein [Longimicrobium sp.]|uniref:hypothetical protein n=1 Tax=Longimicrobium sp. TaxID=2029185 RepID=UPI002C85E1C8|nr:hypothetical protein [Longimicrobium sp.]HSU13914.1 hypothetical protein [Longimicrobium sp.]